MMLSLDRITEILTEISKYEVTLANDPTVLGPKYLQDQIATCRNYTNHTARLLNEVHRAIMAVDYEYRRKETAFQIASDELLSQNQHVRNLPNITDRQAQINILLKDEHRELERLRNDLKDLQHVERMVKNTHRELKDSMTDIKVQRSLIRDEIDTGRMYGDERNSNRDHAYTPGGGSKPEDIDEAEIDRMLRGEQALEGEDEVKSDLEVILTEEVPPSEAVSAPEAEPTAPVALVNSPALTDEQLAHEFLGDKGSEVPVKKIEPLIKKNTDDSLKQSAVSDQDFSDLFEQM